MESEASRKPADCNFNLLWMDLKIYFDSYLSVLVCEGDAGGLQIEVASLIDAVLPEPVPAGVLHHEALLVPQDDVLHVRSTNIIISQSLQIKEDI